MTQADDAQTVIAGLRLTWRQLGDDKLIARFELSGARVWLVRLSPDGKLLAAEYRPDLVHAIDKS